MDIHDLKRQATRFATSPNDTPTRKVEDSLNRIVIRWAENVGRQRIEKVLDVERKRKAAEQEELRRQEEMRRAAPRLQYEQRQHAERRQIDDLKHQLARWQESRQIRAYVDAFRQQAIRRHGTIEPGSRIDQ